MPARLAVPTLTLALATVLWLAMGQAAVVNYDTLYGLLWGKELLDGALPDMTVPGAPTPHPLLTLWGVVVAPLLGSASPAALSLIAYMGYLATATCVVLLGLVATRSLGAAAAVVAALLLVTREPVLSYGLRAYLDLPYLALLLGALAVELRKPRAGTPVLGLLLLAGLLRPEAWLLSMAYLAWLAVGEFPGRRTQVVWLALAAGGPVLWGLTDLLLTGDLLFSFSGTRAGTERLERPTGLSGLVNIAPRRIGEILRWEVILGAAAGALLLLRADNPKAKVVAVATAAAAAAFALVAIGGLPVIVRYLLPLGAAGCLACAYALTGWRSDPSIPFGRAWAAGAGVLTLALLLLAPEQARRLDRLQSSLSAQQITVTELEALTREVPCGPIIVPNRRAVPLVALWTGEPARGIVTAQDGPIPDRGSYLLPSTQEHADAFILDARDRDRAIPPPPPGFDIEDRTTRWVLAARCD
ncbi:MAG: hypothetical protein JHD16_03735 [Solirubrobacteraceae bacterium]|nr:hypothetical protein [Solirubrobacteraceae bacterium]